MTSIIEVHGQRLKFEHYNDGDGLSHNSVRHIVQDKKGFLWLGTFSGLNRFDGYQFKTYTTSSKEESVKSDDITALELDEDLDNLWIGTRNGLTLLNLETHKFSTFLPDENNPNSIPDKEIRGVFVDDFKRVWVGTFNSGVYLFYPEREVDIPIRIISILTPPLGEDTSEVPIRTMSFWWTATDKKRDLQKQIAHYPKVKITSTHKNMIMLMANSMRVMKMLKV